MNINIYNYLQNFEEMNLPNVQGVLLEDDDRIKLISESHYTNNPLSYYEVDNKHGLFVKKFLDCKDKNSSRYISELLNARILERNEINCVRTYPFIKKSDAECGEDFTCVGSEDLTRLKGIQLSDDNEFLMDLPWQIFKHDKSTKAQDDYLNEWLIVTSPQIKDFLLSHMTEECYDDLVILMIADRLLYNFDRFGSARNLFFAKEDCEEKIQTVVPIDLECIDFDSLGFFFLNTVNKFMKNFYTEPIQMTTAHGASVCMTYLEYLDSLKSLIKSGHLSDRQMKFINNVLSLDIQKEICDILSKYNLDINDSVLKIYGEMWKRNADALGL